MCVCVCVIFIYGHFFSHTISRTQRQCVSVYFMLETLFKYKWSIKMFVYLYPALCDSLSREVMFFLQNKIKCLLPENCIYTFVTVTCFVAICICAASLLANGLLWKNNYANKMPNKQKTKWRNIY